MGCKVLSHFLLSLVVVIFFFFFRKKNKLCLCIKKNVESLHVKSSPKSCFYSLSYYNFFLVLDLYICQSFLYYSWANSWPIQWALEQWNLYTCSFMTVPVAPTLNSISERDNQTSTPDWPKSYIWGGMGKQIQRRPQHPNLNCYAFAHAVFSTWNALLPPWQPHHLKLRQNDVDRANSAKKSIWHWHLQWLEIAGLSPMCLDSTTASSSVRALTPQWMN